MRSGRWLRQLYIDMSLQVERGIVVANVLEPTVTKRPKQRDDDVPADGFTKSMASIGHLAAGLACKWTLRPNLDYRVLLFLVAASYLPDLDVIAFAVGIPYEHPFGHRGASHSIAFAALLGAAVAWRSKRADANRLGVAVGLACVSHGLLDMMTDGGLGVALWWPLSNERLFLPWQPLPVSPIGADFISQAGLRIAATEVVCLLPLFVLAFWPRPR